MLFSNCRTIKVGLFYSLKVVFFKLTRYFVECHPNPLASFQINENGFK